MQKKKRGTLHPSPSSIIIDIQPILKLRGITAPYAYLQKIGINKASAQKILHGKAPQLNLIQLTKLCVALNCTPNDLYALRHMQLPAQHELQKLPQHGAQPTPTLTQFLKTKTLDEIRAIVGGGI